MAETLVQRLREFESTFAGYDLGETITEAAAEIERLAAEVERKDKALRKIMQDTAIHSSTIARDVCILARQALAGKEGSE